MNTCCRGRRVVEEVGGVGGGGGRMRGVEGRERRDAGGEEGTWAVGNDDRDWEGVALFVLTPTS